MTEFEYVAQAVSTGGPRLTLYPALGFVYCDGEFIVASDSGRIYWTDNDQGLESGYYMADGKPLGPLELDFPDWKRHLAPDDSPFVVVVASELKRVTRNKVKLVELAGDMYRARDFDEAVDGQECCIVLTSTYENSKGTYPLVTITSGVLTPRYAMLVPHVDGDEG